MASTDPALASPLLVTGGAGFIGSNFMLDHLADPAACAVVNLDVLTYAANPRNLDAVRGDARHMFVQGDILNRELLDRLFRTHRPRAVVHFAAESHVDRSIHGPAAFLRTNIDGTFTLLEAARAFYASLEGEERAAFRFLHVSTDEVYGTLRPDDAAFHEETPFAPNSPYAASKASSDHLVRAWHHTYGLPTLVTNCSNNYGPLQFPEKLIPLTLLNALAAQATADLRRWIAGAGLAVCGGPLPRDRDGAGAGDGGRDVQRGRIEPADEPFGGDRRFAGCWTSWHRRRSPMRG